MHFLYMTCYLFRLLPICFVLHIIPYDPFMHLIFLPFYFQGYFLLRSLANTIGEDTYFSFLGRFVNRFHGQLILSQVSFKNNVINTIEIQLVTSPTCNKLAWTCRRDQLDMQ